MADQRLHPIQRLLHGENRIAGLQVQRLEVIAGADTGIGLHQIQNRGGILDLALALDAFGDAAHEKVPALLIAPHQARRGPTHRLQPFQLKRQMRGQLLARRALFGRIGRQQQARLQEGQPGGHDQVIRRQFDAQPLGGLDEAQVLLGQLQNRDLPQIDLLRPRQGQQQVQRALEAIDIDDKRLAAALFLGGETRGRIEHVG